MMAEQSAGSGGRRWARILGIVFSVGIVTFCLGLIVGNLVIQHEAVRGRVAKRLGGAIGGQATIEHLSFSPLTGLSMSGVSCDPVRDDRPAMHFEKVRAEVNYLPLLKGVIELDEIEVDAPEFVFTKTKRRAVALVNMRNPDQSITAGSEPNSEPEPAFEDGNETEVADVASTSKSKRPTVRRPVQPAKPSGLQISFGDAVVAVTRGKFTLLSEDKKTELLTVDGYEVAATLEKLAGGELGTFRAGSASVLGREVATEVEGRIAATTEGGLSIEELKAKSVGGSVNGKLQSFPRRPGLPFSLELEVSGAQVAMLSAKVLPEDRDLGLSGSVAGSINLQGFAKALKGVRGEADFHVDDAQIPLERLLEEANLSAAIRGNRPEVVVFDFVEGKVSLSGGKVQLSDLNVNCDDLVVRGVGSADLGGDIGLAVRVYLPNGAVNGLANSMAKWPDSERLEFGMLEDTSHRFRDFVFSGTVRKPTVDLWERNEWLPVAEVIDRVVGLHKGKFPPRALIGSETLGE